MTLLSGAATLASLVEAKLAGAPAAADAKAPALPTLPKAPTFHLIPPRTPAPAPAPVKTFSQVVAELTAVKAAFLALRDAQNAIAKTHADNIVQHTVAHDTATAQASQADAAAANIDQILAPINAAAAQTAAISATGLAAVAAAVAPPAPPTPAAS